MKKKDHDTESEPPLLPPDRRFDACRTVSGAVVRATRRVRGAISDDAAADEVVVVVAVVAEVVDVVDEDGDDSGDDDKIGAPDVEAAAPLPPAAAAPAARAVENRDACEATVDGDVSVERLS